MAGLRRRLAVLRNGAHGMRLELFAAADERQRLAVLIETFTLRLAKLESDVASLREDREQLLARHRELAAERDALAKERDRLLEKLQ